MTPPDILTSPPPSDTQPDSPKATLQGTSQIEESKIPYQWKLQALEEYKIDDEKLSREICPEIALLLEENGINHCSIQIDDRYLDEPENDPHYRLQAYFGSQEEQSDLPEEITFSIGYKSIDEDDHTCEGTISVKASLPSDFPNQSGTELGLFVQDIFLLYDAKMFEYYPAKVEFDP